MDLDNHPDILRIRKHLVEHLGPPDEVFEVSGSPLPDSPVQSLNLAYFAPAGPHSPVVFATCGASLFQMKDGRRVEAMMVHRREPQAEAFDAVHRLLASFALFAEANDEIVRIGDVVRAPTELEGFCKMDAVLFMPPVPFVPTFHRVEITKNREVELVWLLPVYDAEANYALENGPQSLMMLFAAQGLDLTEMDRDEANTLIRPEDAEELAKRAMEEAQKKAEEAAPTPMMTTKQKSSRRDMGRGSFDVVEEGAQVVIARRGSKKKKKPAPPPEPVAPAPEPEEAAPPPAPPPPAAAKPRPPPPKRRGGAVKPPAKNEVKFDLSRGKLQKRPPPEDPQATAPPPKKKKARPLTAEEEAEAKKKRIAELKANAQAAAERAAARESGEMPAADPNAMEPDPGDKQATPRRRGGPRPGPKRGD